jgi:hypothetical protein
MERIEGFGQLQRETDGLDSRVRFTFLVMENRLPSTAGIPRSVADSDTIGSVSAADGHLFTEGTYRLFASDGQQMRVQKLGADWYLLWPLWA